MKNKIYNQYFDILDFCEKLQFRWCFIACNGSISDKYFLSKYILQSLHKILFQFEIDKNLLKNINEEYKNVVNLNNDPNKINIFFYSIKEYLDSFYSTINRLSFKFQER